MWGCNQQMVRTVVMDEIRCALEWREDESRQSPGTLSGILLVYEKRASDRPEMFSRGALYWPDTGIIINEQHDRKSAVVRTVPIVDGDVVRIDQPLPDTQRGRDLATSIRNGTYTGLSTEFFSEQETRQGNLRVIKRARLGGAAVVDTPSYGDSLVEVRNQTDHDRILLAARLSL